MQYSDTAWRIGNCVAYTDLYGSLSLDVGFTPISVVKFWRLEKQVFVLFKRVHSYLKNQQLHNTI